MPTNDSPKRLALVINTLTGTELTGGKRDVSKVYSVLTDPKFGACSVGGSTPVVDCDSRSTFEQKLSSLLKHWNSDDQLILYFSGHGKIRGETYCLKFGKPDNEEFLPFDNVLNELKSALVTRAIIILDACFSGAGIKSDSIEEIVNSPRLPQGIAILASSKPSQLSYELDDGSLSIFTYLFCEGIETGLNKKPTADGQIAISDIADFINKGMETDEFKKFSQRAVYNINKADRSIWISKNSSGSSSSSTIEDQPLITTNGELQVLYEKIGPDMHPCYGASLDDLDWDLVKKFYTRKRPSEKVDSLSPETILKQLDFYSAIPYQGKECLHKSAVLCFAKQPDIFYPEAKSTLFLGNLSDVRFVRDNIQGPLSKQVDELVAKILEKLDRISDTGKSSQREETLEIDIAVIRELVSNAIAHRNYEQKGNVTVVLSPNVLEIKSPGKFPQDVSWFDILGKNAFGSHPVNARIADYLANLLNIESVGHGLALVKKYIEANEPNSVTMTEYPGPITCISVLRNKHLKLVNTEGNVIKSYTLPSELPSDFISATSPILIVAATKVEVQAILNVFSAKPQQARHAINNKIYYDLGVHGGKPVFLVQSEMGSATPGGALLTVRQAIQDLHPEVVIMCGIAYGLRPKHQQLGDILVAKQLQYYEPQKVDLQNGQIPRGDRTTVSERLLDRAHSADLDWTGEAKIYFGLVLSGEKLVNDPAFRDWLIKAETEAIGGEMEGAGLYAAARDARADWILVKAICGWMDGNKNTDNAQELAAANAAQFVFHMLKLGGW